MGTLSVLSVLSVVNSSHSAVGIVLRTTPPGNRELHPVTRSCRPTATAFNELRGGDGSSPVRMLSRERMGTSRPHPTSVRSPALRVHDTDGVGSLLEVRISDFSCSRFLLVIVIVIVIP